MIVQCEACQTRFRLADEKIKPGGTKVRCSKCKEIFTVNPPPAEPAEETVDYGSFNMEPVVEETPAAAATPEPPPDAAMAAEQTAQEETVAPPAPDQQAGGELDFSAFEEQAGGTEPAGDVADEFSFVDTSHPSAEAASEAEPEAGFAAEEEQTDFGAAFAENAAEGGPVEFDFGEDVPAAEAATSLPFSAEEPAGPAEFSFDEEESPQQNGPPEEFDFGAEDDGAFAFDDQNEAASPAAAQEYSEPGEFSFEEENSFDADAAAEWGDSPAADDTSFDFEEPSFDSHGSRTTGSAAGTAQDELQFGEIDFAGDGADNSSPDFETGDDFAKATVAKREEPPALMPKQPQVSSAPRESRDQQPLPVAAAKKSSLSRVLVLLVLLLVALGGAAGYLFMQGGSLSLNAVAQYLPFLQDYIGEPAPVSPGDRIGINIIGSSYVNGQAGQMLVIQGKAINNHPTTRSAITIKGMLLDAQGNTLLQQTVFCGNQLDDAALSSMPFAAIEEAMNNQFGSSLSNMNVAAGASIPFTIVFRNLPAGIASINVEVVDSKPGAG